jgi:hypothetical protein
MTTPSTIAPEKSLVSENGTAQSKPQQAPSEIDKLVKANTTLAVWLVFLAIGGGLLALYYSRIRYLPDIEWKAALIYLFAASIVGGVIGLLLTLSLYLPGVIWSEFMVFDSSLGNHLTYDLRHQEPSGKESLRKEPCMRSIMKDLGLPFLGVLLISHVALRAPKLQVSESSVIKTIDLYWIIAIALLLATFFGMRWLFRKRLQPNECGDQKDTTDRQIFNYSFWFTLSVFLNQISMYLIYRMSGTPSGWFDFLVLTTMCTTGVWVSSLVVAARHRYYPRQAVIASLVAAGVLLFTADAFSSLSKQLMSYYGFGGSQTVNVLLSDHGGEIVNRLGVPQCNTLQLCNVEILSKVGDEYFLKVGDQTYVTLPKSDVVAIKR